MDKSSVLRDVKSRGLQQILRESGVFPLRHSEAAHDQLGTPGAWS